MKRPWQGDPTGGDQQSLGYTRPTRYRRFFDPYKLREDVAITFHARQSNENPGRCSVR